MSLSQLTDVTNKWPTSETSQGLYRGSRTHRLHPRNKRAEVLNVPRLALAWEMI